MALRAVFPGSFDPLTVAHLGIADAVRAQLRVDRLDLAISRVALAKEHRAMSPIAERVAAIERHRLDRRWLRAAVTDAQLLADVAAGYDVVVLGADKWHQIHDVVFYDGSVIARDDAIARLPRVALVPRPGSPLPEGGPDRDGTVVLSIPEWHGAVSSTAVRSGRADWRA